MSIMSWTKRIAVIGALALGGTASGAATVTFNFSGGYLRAPTLSFSQGALNLLVTASHFRPVTGAITGGGKVTRVNTGLGERTGLGDDTGRLDGTGGRELLLFAFSSKVKIENISFSVIKPGSIVTGFVNDVMLGRTAVHPFMDVSSLNLAADNFGIGAGSNKSAFRIASITVSTVPLPAGGLLLGTALFGLTRLRRKRAA